MLSRFRRLPSLALCLMLPVCAQASSHWVQGASPGNALLPPPAKPIEGKLTLADLRAALLSCARRYDGQQLDALIKAAARELPVMLAGNEVLDFNRCMSGMGWLSVPDRLLTP